MSARLTLSASLAARPPQPRSSLRRRVRGGRVPPLAAPRHSALQPSFLTLFCPSLPLSPRLFADQATRRSWGTYSAPAGLLSGAPGGVPGAARPLRQREDAVRPGDGGALRPEPEPWLSGFVQPPRQIVTRDQEIIHVTQAWASVGGTAGESGRPNPSPGAGTVSVSLPPISPHSTRSLGSLLPTLNFHLLEICVPLKFRKLRRYNSRSF